ncbi:mental retardation GTPase activating protein 4 [Tripterygium wilfordii]|uniref:Mental retardation GTPase activating protein 4 n=1 Tax=Tripterygium wilfordii TaxID=458696 RepID=A0A7J7CNM2_TRIWF|nr:VQ motif-containing protein 22-like [Tripterygium wilfordii]KAF5735664.1 mental retardation GTPase activating protein 4 [Tripterygium wilfordii]
MSDNPTDWVQFYQQSIPNATAAVTTNATTTTTSTQFGSSSSGGGGGGGGGGVPNLSPEGRVSKPTRRRSRASRRTPTTLLNTDTSNFRAMVQQFTGGPTAPFGSTVQQHAGVQNISFGLGPRSQAHVNNAHPNPLMAPYHMQYQQQQFQRNQPQFMFSGNPDDVFFQRIGNPRPDATVSGGFVVEGVTSDVAAAAAAATRPPNSSSNENRSNTFLY